MSRKRKVSNTVLINACKKYQAGKGSFESIALEIGLDYGPFRRWYYRYLKYGEDAFIVQSSNNTYTKEFKMDLIKQYNRGKSVLEITSENNITESMVRRWINEYNNFGEVREYSPCPEVYSMKSRKVTIEEKKEIIQYVLTNDNDYKGAAMKFAVPYANVFQWVKKYKQIGELSLSDHRGRPSKNTKSTKVLTDEELKDIEIAKLKKELELKDKIITILKKNEEIRQRMMKNSRK